MPIKVRNPLDAMLSFYYYEIARLSTHSADAHTFKSAVGLGVAERERMHLFAKKYVLHYQYWRNVPLRKMTIRYEDIRRSPVIQTMAMMEFVLPEDQLPPLEQLSCLNAADESREACELSYSRHDNR